jgi:PKD repeat protein
MKSLISLFFILLCIFSGLVSNSQNIETLVLRPGPEVGFDAEVRTDMNYPIWYDDDFIANAWTVSGNPFLQRSLIKFDLTSIPQGSEIVSARLSLFCNTTSGHHQLHAGLNSSYLLRITSEWDQYSVVWDNQPDVTIDNAVILPQSSYQTQDYSDIDVTSHIIYFYNHPQLNYGFLLKLVEEDLYSALVFASSNHLDALKRPLLEIDYIPCQKPDTSFSYSISENSNKVSFALTSNNSTTYWWDFGNGYYSDIPEPVFTYQQTGNYNVCLTVSNECDTLTNCETVVVCSDINAKFNYDVEGTSVEFQPELSAEGIQYLWDFGDGFLSYLPEPVHNFNNFGDYIICLTVSNECNSVQYCDSISLKLFGAENKEFNLLLTLYPNPTSGMICIRKGETPLIFNNVTVYGTKGEIVLNISELSQLNRTEGIICDLSNFSGGLYSFVIETDKGKINRRVILQSKK